MANTDETKPPSKRDIYEATFSGAQEHPYIPRLRSDPPPYHALPRDLQDFRRQEGWSERKRRLRELWKRLPRSSYHGLDPEASAKTVGLVEYAELTPERAEMLKNMYENELLGRCGGHTSGSPPELIGWKEFNEYVESKEEGWCCSNFSTHN
jgi:solute carrier family 25 phosphate transporter 23/24/25/41